MPTQTKDNNTENDNGLDDFNSIVDNNFSDAEEQAMETSAAEGAQDDATIKDLENSFNDSEPIDYSQPNDFYKGDNNAKFNASGAAKKVFTGKAKGGILGILGIILIVGLVLALADLLKIPNYAENVALYRMTRLAQDYTKTSAKIDAEKIALESSSVSDAKYNAVKEKYSSLRNNTWGKFDKLRPEIVYQNLGTDGKLSYITKTTKTGRTIITAVRINGGEPIPINETSKFNPIKNYQEKIRFSAQIEANVDVALKGHNTLIRGSVAKQIRQRVGIQLHWWEKFGRGYSGLSGDEAMRLQYKESVERLSPESSNTSTKTAGLKEDQNALKQAIEKCDNDPKCVDETIKNNKPAEAVSSVIDEAGKKSFVQKAAGAASIVYAVGVPLCMVYDGSIVNMQPIIDEQQDSASKAYYAVKSADQQLRAGDTTIEATGAFNRKLGDGDSTIDQAARGEIPDTNMEHSPQANTMGSYNIINSLFGTGNIANMSSAFADKVCPAVTEPAAMLAIGGIWITGKIITTVVTGGTAGVALTAGEEVAKEVIDVAIKNSIKKSFAKGFAKGLIFKEGGKVELERTLGGKAGDFMGKFFGNLATIEAGTFLAKLYVINSAGLVNDPGRTSGTGFKNLVDMGGDIQASELERMQLFAAPLTNAAVAQSDAQDIAYINNKYAQKNPYERYFAVSNPRSLISKFSYSVGNFKKSPFSSIASALNTKNLANIFSFGLFNKYVKAAEDTNPLDAHFGLVQWGWSQEEQNLIESDSSYGILENTKIISDTSPARIKEIEDKHMRCFTETIGTLLSSGAINREEDGAVKEDDAPCSPKTLGPNNPEYGDLVFRWRLDKKYNSILDQNLAIQNPTNDSANNTAGDPTVTPQTIEFKAYDLTGYLKKYTDQQSITTALDSGKKLDFSDCSGSWKDQTINKITTNINWTNSIHFCWPQSVIGNGYRPQGISGTASTTGYTEVANRNILMTSWYSESSESVFTNDAGKDENNPSLHEKNKLVVVDVDTKKYKEIELVMPCDTDSGTSKMCILSIHAGGVAWLGQKIIVAYGFGFYTFDLENLRNIDGRLVLPASGKWKGKNLGLDQTNTLISSSLSKDNSTNQLVSANYLKSDRPVKIYRWNLNGNSTDFASPTSNTSVNHESATAIGVQGITSYKGVTMANSSDAGDINNVLYYWKSLTTATATGSRMPSSAVEGLYVDANNDRVWSLTELSPTKWVFSYPLSDVMKNVGTKGDAKIPEVTANPNGVNGGPASQVTNGQWGWPLEKVIKSTGYCFADFSNASGSQHNAIDLSAPAGTKVLAPADGQVTADDPDYRWGKIMIKHSDGVYSFYEHMRKFNVGKNQTVKKGDVIGEVGDVGSIGAFHLHFGITNNPSKWDNDSSGNGYFTNPLIYINDSKSFNGCAATPKTL